MPGPARAGRFVCNVALAGLGLLAAGCASPPAPAPATPASVHAHVVAADACPIPGDAVHWQADACLFESETDDIIAAQPCLERFATLRFRDACAEKRFYKQRLCEGMVAAGTRAGTVEACIADPAVIGTTVRNGGV